MNHWVRSAATNCIGLACCLSLFAQTATAQKRAAIPTAKSEASQSGEWWKNAVIYEIYPRSFQDSNGDGIGDLNGITARLDYLKELGVDAIWITPCFPSPQVDFGYDISDYERIDPQYGTMADFDHLVAEAKKRHIRILLDMVMNHTSDQHKWFTAARSSRKSPYRDWFVWRDGKNQTSTDKGTAPNNWQSAFGGSSWQWDETTRQFYYHKYYVQQPDLNWNNPKVHEAFKNVIKFWLKRGVGGFRFDAIDALFEDPQFRNEEVVKDEKGAPRINPFGEQELGHAMTGNQPGIHTVLAEIRAYTDTFPHRDFPGDRVLVGETFARDAGELAKLYGTPDHPELQLPMNMQLGGVQKLDAAEFRTRIKAAEQYMHNDMPLWVFDNHDRPRLDMRYGDGIHDTEIQRAIATILFLTRGTALMYYGDEIGMKTTPPTRREDVRDPQGITGWPREKGRDGERTPMQWNAKPKTGFTEGNPWLPVPASASAINVESEELDSASLLNWYKQLIALKKNHAAFFGSEDLSLDEQNHQALTWMRIAENGARVVISVNLTATPQTVKLEGAGFSGSIKTLLASQGTTAQTLSNIQLAPFGVLVAQLP